MAIMDDIRRMMAERAAQGIGTGGGLMGSQQGQPGLLGSMSNINPNLLIGASIAGAGLRGVDPFSSILPAVTQKAQLQKYLTPEEKELKKPFEAKNIQTGQNVFITPDMYAANPELYQPIEKAPLVKMISDKVRDEVQREHLLRAMQGRKELSVKKGNLHFDKPKNSNMIFSYSVYLRDIDLHLKDIVDFGAGVEIIDFLDMAG